MRIHIAKYSFRLMITLSLLCNISYSQIDSSSESFFPHHVGDIWEYDNINSVYKIALTKDSSIQSSSFLFYNKGDVPYYEIDSSLHVIQYPTISKWTEVLINLKANLGEWWISEDSTSENPSVRIVGRIDDISWGNVFGIETQIKRVGYYYQPVTDTTDFHFWRNDRYFAAGMGYLLSQYDAGPPTEQLMGCIINGLKYGAVSSVYTNPENKIVLAYKLLSAFPNPFNPSTTISYQLPGNDFVNLRVFDMLGKEITILVNEEQQKGYHQIRFKPQNLSSGIYLIRMNAGVFSQTTKIIYSK
jgi:hypothetical protein